MGENRFSVSELTDLSGRVALITGGGTGIGLMIAKGLANNGAKVYIAGRRLEVLQAASELLFDGERRMLPLQMDVTDKSSIQAAVDFISKAEEKLHILVNNAGFANAEARTTFVMDPTAPERQSTATYGKAMFDSQMFSHWEHMFSVNVTSNFFVTFAFLGLLEASTAGIEGATASIINISSAVVMTNLSHSVFSYCATKAGTVHLTQMLATDFALKGIPVRVNGIAPGVFPSQLMGSREHLEAYTKTPLQMLLGIPMKRAGKDEEIATLAVYLASPVSGYMTGQEIALDGGFTHVNP